MGLTGVERLAFSVTWDMTPEGAILSQWAGRSVIKSCVKLAYGHAQDMIEGTFQGLPDQEPPPVELHGCTWPEVHVLLFIHGIPCCQSWKVCVSGVLNPAVQSRFLCTAAFSTAATGSAVFISQQ